MSKSGWLVLIILFSGLAAQSEDLIETETMGGTVSVEELLNPLTGKSLRMILNAQRDLRSGQKDRGMAELRQALADPQAKAYALSMLGSEHLKARQVEVALDELEEAVRLLPGRAENHSNLALALGLTGAYQRASAEARKALQLDPARAKTRFVLGLVLLERPETAEEGMAHLKAAARELPAAGLALAYYESKRQPEPSHAGALSFQAPVSR